MTGAAFALALGAAALHALWNLLLAGARDPRAATAAALGVGVVVWAPVAALTGSVHAGVWPYVAGSATVEAVYYLLLGAAYGRGELSAVYPVARGGAPVILLVAALAGLGGAVGGLQVLGVLVAGAGIVAVHRGAHTALAPGAVATALLISAAIAGYTLLDRAGLHHADPLPYLWLVLTPSTAVCLLVTARERGAGAVRAALDLRAVVAGVATVGAYGLALLALRLAPAAPVAAVRETSIVLAVALGAIVLREPVTRLRWAGAATVTVGTALVALG
ncbi:EamA family transporter [Baekduia soli]|uniref:EamA family transporter n=1 Tax=Baekduia soli TaxID=496014 RepID=A0A5B8U3Q5_9ACTN|nr:EamA family transporter [Baekduia soli]QEC47686.1 EamA family transporter [Baekduia soli]